MFKGPGANNIEDIWRGQTVESKQLGAGLRIELGHVFKRWKFKYLIHTAVGGLSNKLTRLVTVSLLW